MNKGCLFFVILCLLLAGCQVAPQTQQTADTPDNIEARQQPSAEKIALPHSTFAELYAAAKNGKPEAQYRLGLAYAEGKETNIDVPEALNWWRKAAESCKSDGRCKLQAPADFSCKNGQRFTIVFLNKKEIAYLAFPHAKEFEILRNAQLGTGIGYKNERYVFEEHQKHVTLDNIWSKKGRKPLTSCREVNLPAKTRTE